jgi:hypothetical protein
MSVKAVDSQFSLSKTILRDARMELIASKHNIAPFISLDDRLRVRYARMRPPQRTVSGAQAPNALSELFAKSQSGQVNLRFFAPGQSTGAILESGFRTVDEALRVISQKKIIGGYVIASESIDLHDGGVAGVLSGDIIEFLQGVTPRFVDQCSEFDFPQMMRNVGVPFLRSIYGPDIEFDAFLPSNRVEFSTHPVNTGTHCKKLVIWDYYNTSVPTIQNIIPFWPNRLSEWLGDKLYGELLAWCMGFKVPRTKAYLHPRLWSSERGPIVQWVPPDGISFGEVTGNEDIWVRTAPRIPQPGLFPTFNYWRDPIELMLSIDPDGKEIGSCLVQQNVRALYSGSGYCNEDNVLVEGVAGSGEGYMLGEKSPEPLPELVANRVVGLGKRVFRSFGPSRFEWAFDGDDDWLLQLNPHIETRSYAIGYEQPGISYLEYDPCRGISQLEMLIKIAQKQGQGILLARPVGLTSHVCEILNHHKVPYAVRR